MNNSPDFIKSLSDELSQCFKNIDGVAYLWDSERAESIIKKNFEMQYEAMEVVKGLLSWYPIVFDGFCSYDKFGGNSHTRDGVNIREAQGNTVMNAKAFLVKCEPHEVKK